MHFYRIIHLTPSYHHGRHRKTIPKSWNIPENLVQKQVFFMINIKITTHFPGRNGRVRQSYTAGKTPERIMLRSRFAACRYRNSLFVRIMFIISDFSGFFGYLLSVICKKFTFLRIPSIDPAVTICYHNITTQSKQGTFRKGGKI